MRYRTAIDNTNQPSIFLTVEVLNTGTELLLGSIVNTHLAYLGRTLFSVGLRITRQTTVPDGEMMKEAFSEAFRRCEILIITGGLGPTTDDITRECLAELLNLPLLLNDEVLKSIQIRCARRGFAFQERMRRQAMVPEGAVVLPNDHGTAPGLYVAPREMGEWRTPHIFLLPGPPRELRPMFEAHVMPRLRDMQDLANAPASRIYRCVGIGESLVESRIGMRLTEIPGLEVGYCARPNEVDLRLIGAPSLLDQVEPLVLEEIGEFVFSSTGQELEDVIVAALRERGMWLATAESCTGGLLANRVTNVPGASEVFSAGWVTYANEIKTAQLGVEADLLETVGAVSEPVARQMAEGALLRSGADFALSTTGIAGPGGGTDEKPVGTVFLALAQRDRETIVWREFFPTDRATFKELVTQSALNALRKRLGRGEVS
jgi:nicotinamide-nucleotide amidase